MTARITEWQPTSLRSIPGIAFFASALAVVALIGRRGRTTPWPTLAWLAVFFVIGVYALRGVAWWPLGAVAAIAGVLVTGPALDPARPERDGSPLMQRLNLVVAGAIVLVGIALLPVWRPLDPDLDAPEGVVGNAPPGITTALRDLARPGDRLFNPQPWGSWFEFALPDLPVAIDSRIELFPAAVWDTYENIVAGGEAWREQLAGWGASIVVVRLPGGGDGRSPARRPAGRRSTPTRTARSWSRPLGRRRGAACDQRPRSRSRSSPAAARSATGKRAGKPRRSSAPRRAARATE